MVDWKQYEIDVKLPQNKWNRHYDRGDDFICYLIGTNQKKFDRGRH